MASFWQYLIVQIVQTESKTSLITILLLLLKVWNFQKWEGKSD